MSRSSLAAALVVFSSCLAQAELRTPAEFLGHEVGADRQLADWATISAYLQHVAAESPRVHVEQLGRSSQGRPFLLAIVADEAGIERRDGFRKITRALYDPRTLSEREARIEATKGRAIIAVSLGLHSTEVGASQASMEMLYQLATREDALFAKIRSSLLLLIIPSMNPDGLDIVVDWYRETLGSEAEGSPPPWLYHHYAGHDNNRDGFFNNLNETALWSKLLYEDWLPQMIVDEHQMGNGGPRLFLPPFDDPISPSVHPLVYTQLGAAGQQVVNDLTALGHQGIATSTIFTAEWPGSVRSTGFWHNMLGILSEVASARIATPLYFPPGSLSGAGRGLPEYEQRANFLAPWPGGWWRLRNIVDLELDLSWAFFDWAAQHTEDLLFNFWAMNRDAVERGRAEAPYGFVVSAKQHDRTAIKRMTEILLAGGIEMSWTDGPVEIEGRRFAEGAVVIDAAQPFRPFLMEMFDSPRYPRLNEWGSDEVVQPYDVTAWDLVHLLHLDLQPIEASGTLGSLELQRLTAPRPNFSGRRDVENWWHLSAAENASYMAVAKGLARGVEIRRATALGDDGVEPGDFLLRSTEPGTLEGVLDDADARGRPLREISASASARPLRRPRIGLYSPWGGSMDEGWTRLILDRYGFEHERLRPDDIASHKEGDGTKLRRRVDVVLFASDSIETLRDGRHPRGEESVKLHEPRWPEAYRGGMSAGVTGDRLEEFVRSGGRIIAFDEATPWLVEEMGLPVEIELEDMSDDAFYAPGTLLFADIDRRHPLAWGMPARSAVYFAGGKSFKPIAWPEPTAVVATYAEEPLAAGFLTGAEHLARRPALVEIPVGDGAVVLFGFSPQRRAQTEMTFKLLLNSLLGNGG